MSSTIAKALIPTLFLSHGGGPGFFMKVDPRSPFAEISQDSPAHQALKAIGNARSSYGLPDAPKSIVVISAHWEEADGFHVFSVPKPGLIYDYYGFPQSTYELEYPAPGSEELAQRIVDMINAEPKLSKAKFDPTRGGFDHGVFMPLLILYPEANIPIVQVSLKSSLDPAEHYTLGKALAQLREENILIIGSGQATHPMAPGCTPQNTEMFIQLLNGIVFNASLTEAERMEHLVKLWKNPLIRATHIPRSEHLVPLIVAAGAARGSVGRDLFRKRKRLPIYEWAFLLCILCLWGCGYFKMLSGVDDQRKSPLAYCFVDFVTVHILT